MQRTLTLGKSITVWLVSSLTVLDYAKLEVKLEYIHAARIQPINGSYLIEHFSVNGKDKNLEKQVGIGMLKSMPIKVLIQISTVRLYKMCETVKARKI